MSSVTRGTAKFSRRSLLCAAGTALAGIVPTTSGAEAPGAQGSQQAAGSVEEARGETFAEAGEQRRSIGRASPIFIKDLVTTGTHSRLRLRLGADTSIQLGEQASLLIDRFLVNAGGEITLTSGAMFFEKRGRDRSSAMKVQTNYGLIEVRGTRFFAGLSNNVFGVFVEEGSVLVSSAGRKVIVNAGQGTDLAKPGTQPTQPRQWGQARIKAALASVR